MAHSKPLVIELFAGSFGWSAGFLAEGYRAVGFDIVHEPYHGPVPDGAELANHIARVYKPANEAAA